MAGTAVQTIKKTLTEVRVEDVTDRAGFRVVLP